MSHFLRRTALLPALFIALFSASLVRAQEAPKVAKVPLTFLALEQARTAIVDDSADAYFDKLTPHEMSAKTGKPITGDTPEAQQKECKARYQAACQEFTDAEQQAVTTLLSRIQPAIERTYPGFAKQPWSFIKVKQNIESGLPHTRGPHIIFTAPVLGAMRQMADAGDGGAVAAASLLVHEQTHVIERLHPELFTDLFTGVFGFRRAKQIQADKWVTDRQLVNPDGTDTNWVFPLKSDDPLGGKTRWIWPLVMFDDPDAPTLHQMTFAALELEPTDPKAAAPDSFKLKLNASGDPVNEPLRAVESYVRSVRTHDSIYHPNEAAADLMARLVITDCLAQPKAAAGKEMEPVRAWAKKAFGPVEGNKTMP